MKKFLLPNTQFFCAIPIGQNHISSIFGLNKQDHEIYNESDPIISRCNKYLMRQEARLIKQAKAKDHLRFEKIREVLQLRSTSFQIATFNHKYPKWFWKSKGSVMKKIYYRVQEILKTNSVELEATRSWIPKGNDEYGRPITAPKIPWRITEFQRLYFINLWVEEAGGKASWQHGGFTGRGVNTFMNQLISRQIFEYKYIWEFDLKGFFNNITWMSIYATLHKNRLPEKLLQNIAGMLPKLPTKYKLPPEEKDKGLQNYKTLMGLTDHILSPWKDSMYYQSYSEELISSWMREDPSQFWNTEIDFPQETRLAIEYKELMENKPHYPTRGSEGITKYLEPTLTDREKGRDSWVGLGRPGHGTPQGVSWSPFVTSLTTGATLNFRNEPSHQGIIMYMDDGLLFSNNKEEMENYINDLKITMKYIGVELAPSKCGYIKQDGEWCKDLKILGTRYDHQIDWVFSSTRSGTVTAMPRPDYEEMGKFQKELPTSEYNTILEGLLNWLVDAKKLGSKKRLIAWLEQQIELYSNKGPRARPTHEYGPTLDMTGPFLSYIWADPNKGDVKRLIKEGQWARLVEIQENPYSFYSDWKSKGNWSRKEELKDSRELTTISTKMIKGLLEWAGNCKALAKRKALREAKAPATKLGN